jgi:hypothetical protein
MAKTTAKTRRARPVTKTRVTKPPTKTGITAIDKLNLRDIVAAVRKERRWSAKTAKEAETWYRIFLAMSQDQGRAAFGIEKKSDYIWHAHITSTIRYRDDCGKIFGPGKFLDHTPTKPKDWRDRLAQSMKAYDARFGIHPPASILCCL